MPSASKSKTLYSGNGYPYTLTASFNENSTSIDNNTSNVTCTATFSAGNTNWETSYASTLTIYWHDNKENYDRQVASISFAGISKNSSKTASGSINVTHKDDGTLSGYVKAVFTKGSTTTAWACNSGDVYADNSNNNPVYTALSTIARASEPTISPSSTFNIGSTITINTNRKSNSFTHTLSLSFGSYSYQIGTNVGASTTLNTSTIANSLYQQIPNANSGTGTITCITYNGSTQVGTKSVSFTAKVVNSNPTFNQAYLDTNSTTTTITQNNQQIIRNKSTLQINITSASAKNYSTLSSSKVVINGITYNGTFSGSSSTINVGTINVSSNTTAKVSVIDSRGNTTTKDLAITILDWVQPSAIIKLERESNYYSNTSINVNAEYSSLSNKNTISIKVREKKTTEGTWGAYTTLQDEVTSQLDLDNQYAWNVQVVVEDKLATTTYNLVLDRGIPLIFFDREKRSVGINKFPSENSSLEVEGKSILQEGSIVRSMNGGSGTAGWMKIGTFTITGPYQNQIITIEINQRGRHGTLYIRFNNENNNDPSLYTFEKNGNIYACLYKTATSTWDLYINKSEPYDTIQIVRFHKGRYMDSTSFNWNGTGSTVSTPPSGSIHANTYGVNKYSTSEQIVGEWIDGKSIYRKVVFVDTAPQGSLKQIDNVVTNMDTLVSLRGTAYNAGFNQYYNIPNAHHDMTNYYINAVMVGANLQVRVGNGFSGGLTKVNVIIEYTKTTD